MDHSTLLHRQVHPTFIVKDQISNQVFNAEKSVNVASSVFTPTPKDELKLSVYNGQKYTGKEAFEHYIQTFETAGVLSVSGQECIEESLTYTEDNYPFDGHSYIDYSNCSTKGEITRRAKKLKNKAIERGWSYQK